VAVGGPIPAREVTRVDSSRPLCYNPLSRGLELRFVQVSKGPKEVEMPNIKSQIKRMHKSEEQRQRNRSVMSALKTKIKKFETAIQSGDADEARDKFDEASRELDKAATKGVIHKNKAANKKSRMARDLNSMVS